mmetsp:Transcript_48543/g.104012  ORF Transcript_48543/g.104012 Transcript_48543/m.104012 type:complete len:157 (+) Transcript_48543:55-525(+)
MGAAMAVAFVLLVEKKEKEFMRPQRVQEDVDFIPAQAHVPPQEPTVKMMVTLHAKLMSPESLLVLATSMGGDTVAQMHAHPDDRGVPQLCARLQSIVQKDRNATATFFLANGAIIDHHRLVRSAFADETVVEFFGLARTEPPIASDHIALPCLQAA